MEWRKVRFHAICLCMIAVALCLSSCASSDGVTAGEATVGHVELTISAAASLTDALEEVRGVYADYNDNVTLLYNLGSTGALQTQIEEGAPADLFLSAASQNMNELVDGGFIEESKQTNLLGNELVVVVPADSKHNLSSMQDLQGDKLLKIAIGIPESVPAGIYAKEALVKEGLWNDLQDKLVQAKDVRQVLSYVETGNADAGLVYRTDAILSSKSKIAFAVEADSYQPINYPVGIVKESKNQEATAAFYEFLQSQEALDIFVKHGFAIPQ